MGEEMTQTLYAHMNKRKKNRILEKMMPTGALKGELLCF
jgi:hypothetical protein